MAFATSAARDPRSWTDDSAARHSRRSATVEGRRAHRGGERFSLLSASGRPPDFGRRSPGPARSARTYQTLLDELVETVAGRTDPASGRLPGARTAASWSRGTSAVMSCSPGPARWWPPGSWPRKSQPSGVRAEPPSRPSCWRSRSSPRPRSDRAGRAHRPAIGGPAPRHGRATVGPTPCLASGRDGRQHRRRNAHGSSTPRRRATRHVPLASHRRARGGRRAGCRAARWPARRREGADGQFAE